MWTFRVRWRAIFQPLCWFKSHQVRSYLGLHASDHSGFYCARCALDRPDGRWEKRPDGSTWWVRMDWERRVVSKDWRYGPIETMPDPRG